MVTAQGHDSLVRAGLVATAAVLVVLAGAGGGAAERASACKPGVRPFGGVSSRTFCGPATARVYVGGRTLVFTEGTCVTTTAYVSVNIGTVVLGQTTKRQPNYFGLDIGRIPGSGAPPARKDGTYRSGTVLTIEFGGTAYDVLSGVATLQGHRSHGTVRGKAFSGQDVTGTFHC